MNKTENPVIKMKRYDWTISSSEKLALFIARNFWQIFEIIVSNFYVLTEDQIDI